MDNEITLPPRLTTLGIALRPVLARLDAALDHPATPNTPVASMLDEIRARLDAIMRALQRLESCINTLMADVVANEAVPEGEIYRAAGRFEGYLGELSSAYREAQEMIASDSEIFIHGLLAGVYRHVLNEIQSWLSDLVETLIDPRTALEKRGLPLTGQVELRFDLMLSAAPQLAQIEAWARKQTPVAANRLYVGAHALTPNPQAQVQTYRKKPPEPDYRVSAYDLLYWLLFAAIAIFILTTPGLLLLLIFLSLMFGVFSAILGLIVSILTCGRR